MTFSIAADSVTDDGETIVVTGTASRLEPGDGTITINDVPSYDITLSAEPGTIAEDAGATQVTVTATRDGATTDAVTVTLSLGGTAQNPGDYSNSKLPSLFFESASAS